jgi:hypothetical protein
MLLLCSFLLCTPTKTERPQIIKTNMKTVRRSETQFLERHRETSPLAPSWPSSRNNIIADKVWPPAKIKKRPMYYTSSSTDNIVVLGVARLVLAGAAMALARKKWD